MNASYVCDFNQGETMVSELPPFQTPDLLTTWQQTTDDRNAVGCAISNTGSRRTSMLRHDVPGNQTLTSDVLALIARASGDGFEGNRLRCKMILVCKSWHFDIAAVPFCWESGREAAIQSFITRNRLKLDDTFEAMHRAFRFTVAEADRMGLFRRMFESEDAINQIKRARVIWPQLDLALLLNRADSSLAFVNSMDKIDVLRNMGLDLRLLDKFPLRLLVTQVVEKRGVSGLVFLREWGLTIEDLRRCAPSYPADADVLKELASWGLVKGDLKAFDNYGICFQAANDGKSDVFRVLRQNYGLTRDEILQNQPQLLWGLILFKKFDMLLNVCAEFATHDPVQDSFVIL